VRDGARRATVEIPITGSAACCARVASGHASDAPPSADMNCRLPMSMAICLGPNGRGEEYQAPRGRSGSNRACRNAAAWSLTGRSGHGADIVIRSFLTGSGASRPPFTALRKVYSITSSAMESTPAGMVKPSIFVVLRFSASSNFVGCRTGKSAGFRPLEFGRQPQT
jgi:hypothetical protein